jgi:hypothetical protein
LFSGCALFRGEQREPWRTDAEIACLRQKRVTPSVDIVRTRTIDGPGVCGMEYPFRIQAFNEGSVALKTQAVLACPVIPHIDGWLRDVVQPAAQLYYGMDVVRIESGSYSCRRQNNGRRGRMSEHAFGNALDVMAFELSDGRVVRIIKGWSGEDSIDQNFLREVFVGACAFFTTVLGPGADPYHYDHFHLDLARHDPKWQRRICKPIIKFTPLLPPLVAQKS